MYFFLSQVGISHETEHDRSLPEPPTLVVPLSVRPQLKDLDLIKLMNWQGVGLQLGIEDCELQKIEVDYQRLDDRKRKMFRTWLRTTSPNYHDLITALEAVNERTAAQYVREKLIPSLH